MIFRMLLLRMNKVDLCLNCDSWSLHLLVDIFIYAYTLKKAIKTLFFKKLLSVVTVWGICKQRWHNAFRRLWEWFLTNAELTCLFFKILQKPDFTIFLLLYLVYIGKCKRLLELCILMLNMQPKPLSELLDTL